ncbi:MAG: GNAT family N-acetyltransferase [Phycisphaerales bacterium]
MPVPAPNAASPPAWFKRPGVAVFSQLAVEPEIRGTGVGETLIAHAEGAAATLGAEEIACAVPTHAERLLATLTERGYRPVDNAKRGDASFVIVSKTIEPATAAAA